MLEQRFAGDEMKRLARETRRAPARRDDADALAHRPALRMISAAARNLARDPIRAGAFVSRGAVAGLHQDRAHPGVAAALDVDRLVADEEGTRADRC